MKTGAGNEARTRDLNLGKVALYQLSYSRKRGGIVARCRALSSRNCAVAARQDWSAMMKGHAARRYMIIDQMVMTAAATSSTKPTV